MKKLKVRKNPSAELRAKHNVGSEMSIKLPRESRYERFKQVALDLCDLVGGYLWRINHQHRATIGPAVDRARELKRMIGREEE